MSDILLYELGKLSIYTDRIELKVGTEGTETIGYDQVTKVETEKGSGWIPSDHLTIESVDGAVLKAESSLGDVFHASRLIEHFKDKAAGAKSDAESFPLLSIEENPGLWHELKTNNVTRTKLLVYDDHLEWREGSETASARYEHIVGVRTTPSGLSKSNIEVDINGGNGFGVPSVKNADVQTAKELIEHQVAELHNKDYKPTSEAAPQTPDIPDQIRKLSELRDAGALSNEEFESKKRELLDRM